MRSIGVGIFKALQLRMNAVDRFVLLVCTLASATSYLVVPTCCTKTLSVDIFQSTVSTTATQCVEASAAADATTVVVLPGVCERSIEHYHSEL